MQLTTTVKCIEVTAHSVLSMSWCVWSIICIYSCTSHRGMCTSFCLENDTNFVLDYCIFYDHQNPPCHSSEKTFPCGCVLQLTCLHVEMKCIVFVNCLKSPNLCASLAETYKLVYSCFLCAWMPFSSTTPRVLTPFQNKNGQSCLYKSIIKY